MAFVTASRRGPKKRLPNTANTEVNNRHTHTHTLANERGLPAAHHSLPPVAIVVVVVVVVVAVVIVMIVLVVVVIVVVIVGV